MTPAGVDSDDAGGGGELIRYSKCVSVCGSPPSDPGNCASHLSRDVKS